MTKQNKSDEEKKEVIVAEKEVEKMKEKTCDNCEVLTQERDDYKSKYLRALADYQNFEKRMASERINIRNNTIRDIAIQILPFLDHLEKAEFFIKDKGLVMIKTQYIQILKDIGIEEIDVFDKPFDPHTAEAVEVIEGEKDNIVVEVIRKGYVYKEYLLRPAQVKVEKPKEN